MGVWKYIQSAALNRWNLLAVAAGAGVSWFSGRPEIGFGIVAAVEALWVGFAVTNPVYRRHVDITEHQKERARRTLSDDRRMKKMLYQLPRGPRERYNQLLKQCEELRDISRQLQLAHGADENDLSLMDLQLEGLDRLLWMFLRLLHTEHSLNRFFETTSLTEIEKELNDVQDQIAEEEEGPESDHKARVLSSLRDQRTSFEERRRTFLEAQKNLDFVRTEQDRLENRIRSLAEKGLSQGNSQDLSAAVDDVTGSLQETERALSDLQAISGVTETNDDVPLIVPRQTVQH